MWSIMSIAMEITFTGNAYDKLKTMNKVNWRFSTYGKN